MPEQACLVQQALMYLLLTTNHADQVLLACSGSMQGCMGGSKGNEVLDLLPKVTVLGGRATVECLLNFKPP